MCLWVYFSFRLFSPLMSSDNIFGSLENKGNRGFLYMAFIKSLFCDRKLNVYVQHKQWKGCGFFLSILCAFSVEWRREKRMVYGVFHPQQSA